MGLATWGAIAGGVRGRPGGRRSGSPAAAPAGLAAGDPIVVNVDNFARAQADMEFDGILKMSGGINQWHGNREPTPIDKQNVIRMNRDTLYSFAVVDISKGAKVTLPEAGYRYMSLMVINNDGSVSKVFCGGGTYELTNDKFETPFVGLAVRTLVRAGDEADLKKGHKLQDQLKIEAGSNKPFVLPNHDKASSQATLKPLLDLAKGLSGTEGMFGKKDEVDPVHFLIGAAYGWGGLPTKDAVYVNVQPDLPVGASTN